jgi:hypothetical protein
LDWSCDLNTEDCLPNYLFKRVDNEGNVSSGSIGYNYRSVQYFSGNHSRDYTRVVTKYYGKDFVCLSYLVKVCVS